jgi:predicted small secreted protein
MKKRIIIGAAVSLLALALAACGSSSANGQGCGNVCHYLSFLTNIFSLFF